MEDDDPIARKLGLTPMNVVRGDVVEHRTTEIEKSTASKELESDRDYARTNLYDVIETGSRALQEMVDVASQSQHPRAFEVVANLIKTLADVNKDLVALSEKRVPQSEQTTEAPKEVNNNLIFNGSTKELLELMKKQKEEDD